MSASSLSLVWMTTLVAARMTAFTLSAPVLNSAAVPIRWRLGLAGVLCVFTVPVVSTWQAPPDGAGAGLASLFREMIVGCSLGLAAAWLFWGLQVGIELLGRVVGTPPVDGPLSMTQETSPMVLGPFAHYLLIAVFLLIGGHRVVVDAALDSFQWLPPGEARELDRSWRLVADLLQHSFSFGLRVVVPATVAVLATSFCVAAVSRSLPMLSHFTVGAMTSYTTALISLVLSLAVVAWLLQGDLRDAVALSISAWRN